MHERFLHFWCVITLLGFSSFLHSYNLSIEEGQEALFEAAKDGHFLRVNDLLNSGVNPNFNKDGQTPLHVAANVDITRALLDHGAKINSKSKDGTSPLWEAVDRLDLDSTKLLLDRGANPNTADIVGVTPLHIVAMTLRDSATDSNSDSDTKKLLLGRLLLKKGAKLKKGDTGGQTPLHFAVRKPLIDSTDNSVLAGDYSGEIVRLFLDNGANPEEPDKSGKTPLDLLQEEIAIYPKPAIEMIRYQHTPEAQELRDTLFQQAVEYLTEHDSGALRQFYSLNPTIRARMNHLYTPRAITEMITERFQ